MELIVGYLQSGFMAVVPLVILLGLLIFVHELGHFLVAVYCGVRVEVFSLGFGKKIFKYKRGDTTYCISLIPFGGYVKMYGDDPSAVIPEDMKAVSFLHKPVWPRIAIVLAGPLMNLVFAVFLFLLVAVIGEQRPAALIGDIEPTSEAYQTGFRMGDRVVSVDGQKIDYWDDFQSILENSANNNLSIEIQRFSGERGTLNSLADSASKPEDSKLVSLAVTPRLAPNPNILSLADTVGTVDGLNNNFYLPTLGVMSAQSAAGLAGLKSGDAIKQINGTPVATWFDAFKALQSHELMQTSNIELLIERAVFESSKKSSTVNTVKENGKSDGKDQEILVSLTRPTLGSLEAIEGLAPAPNSNDPFIRQRALLAALGIEPSFLHLASVRKDSPAEQAGLQAGDRIVAINGVVVDRWQQVLGQVKAYDPKSGALEIRVRRADEDVVIKATPEITHESTVMGSTENRYTLGILPMAATSAPPLIKYQAKSVGLALSRGWGESWRWTKLTIMSFVRLIQNQISPRNIGGVISIGQIASRSFQIGVSAFVKIMAIISINLFVLNLLPIPILDGGHLVFFTIEAIRGAPLSMRRIEIAQQVGLILLLALMVLALFNDFSRVFGN